MRGMGTKGRRERGKGGGARVIITKSFIGKKKVNDIEKKEKQI